MRTARRGSARRRVDASDQPADGLGDGRTLPDCRVVDEGAAALVRSGLGGGAGARDGRTYFVTAMATDACGNASEAAIVGAVHVPHDGRNHLACERGAARGGGTAPAVRTR